MITIVVLYSLTTVKGQIIQLNTLSVNVLVVGQQYFSHLYIWGTVFNNINLYLYIVKIMIYLIYYFI